MDFTVTFSRRIKVAKKIIQGAINFDVDIDSYMNWFDLKWCHLDCVFGVAGGDQHERYQDQ